MQFEDIWYLRPAGICNAAVSPPIAQAGKGFSEHVYRLGPHTKNIFVQDNDAGDDHYMASCSDNGAQLQILPEMCSLAPD